ncbi:hypothetical protein GTY65_15185 [Streptomyces sp. SID8379]|uniref:hypothetical protein n=1 Tax=unclassified Streptomyces TaxID=2593676 RepID=UPI00036E6D3A|nr:MULTISPECIES: hypothetical protein [unclassified Streptomyces]MYW65392.1 hypothetical protein [Streptomyces sp. SID8379]
MIRKVLTGVALAAAATAATLGASGVAAADGGAQEFATNNGDVAIGGDPGGILNSYGASFVNVDLRCAVPAPQGVGGNVLGGPVAACTNEPVDQFDAQERIV